MTYVYFSYSSFSVIYIYSMTIDHSFSKHGPTLEALNKYVNCLYATEEGHLNFQMAVISGTILIIINNMV